MSEKKFDYPRVGTDVWVRKDGKVLLGLREWTHASATWCLPGGKLEMFEELEDSARREVLEETGVEVANLEFITALNNMYPEVVEHYVSFFYAADWKNGEVELKEPHKFSKWEWFSWDDLPSPLLRSTQNFVDMGINPLEYKA